MVNISNIAEYEETAVYVGMFTEYINGWVSWYYIESKRSIERVETTFNVPLSPPTTDLITQMHKALKYYAIRAT